MKIEFYRCEHCGNIAVKVVDSGVPLFCCGEAMGKLEAGVVDAAKEKHVPAVTVEGGVVSVCVGEVEHPMTPEHYIQLICLVSEQGYQLAPLASDGKPEARFALVEGDKPLAVYEYCNLHGLWVAEL